MAASVKVISAKAFAEAILAAVEKYGEDKTIIFSTDVNDYESYFATEDCILARGEEIYVELERSSSKLDFSDFPDIIDFWADDEDEEDEE